MAEGAGRPNVDQERLGRRTVGAVPGRLDWPAGPGMPAVAAIRVDTHPEAALGKRAASRYQAACGHLATFRRVS